MKIMSVVDVFPNPVQRVDRRSPSDVFLQSFASVDTILLGCVAANRAFMIVDAITVVLLHPSAIQVDTVKKTAAVETYILVAPAD